MAREMDVIRYDKPSVPSLPPQWQMSEKGKEAFHVANAISRIKDGLYANIPIVCKGEKCPYIDTCAIKAVGMNVDEIKGQRCPTEISEIMQRFQWYTEYLGIEPDNLVDLGMVKELVDIDIMLERASKRMAREADFVEMVAVGVDSDGNPIRRPELAKSVDYKERMQKRKDTVLSLLNATRKDKAGSKLSIEMDPSTYAATLMQRKKELDELKKANGIIEVDPIETSDE